MVGEGEEARQWQSLIVYFVGLSGRYHDHFDSCMDNVDHSESRLSLGLMSALKAATLRCNDAEVLGEFNSPQADRETR